MFSIKKVCALALLVASISQSAFADNSPNPASFGAFRKEFKTQVGYEGDHRSPVGSAPDNVFQSVRYQSSVGALSALLTPDPKDGKKHPAIIWITGGDSNSIDGASLSRVKPRANDQSAAAYRKAGVVMMFPSLRGGNDNPGKHEANFGEIDDVLAAADYLAQQPWIDPARIYLGGHSTGGTLVLMVAEASKRFRAVFSFGPVANLRDYGNMIPVNFEKLSYAEQLVRAPYYWLPSVQSPVFIIEGVDGNIDSLEFLRGKSRNPYIKFLSVKGASHFTILAPANDLIARKILLDDGSVSNISLTESEMINELSKK
ncbi:alpha/beta hydrolase family protein [Undibacterium sp. TC4M20W]|uniref:alpha/beta hydrolase family protein n=1 Tax=unclassified Undibacterium TaxID=2630295 RepID=UPI003BF2881E